MGPPGHAHDRLALPLLAGEDGEDPDYEQDTAPDDPPVPGDDP